MSEEPEVGRTSAPESTVELLARARAGDQAALDEVFARAIPLLKRWASGRLPRWTREMIDTDDLVQETVVNTLKHIDVFEYRVDLLTSCFLLVDTWLSPERGGSPLTRCVGDSKPRSHRL